MHGQTAPQICIGKWICVKQGNVGLWECTTQIYCRGHGGFIVQASAHYPVCKAPSTFLGIDTAAGYFLVPESERKRNDLY